MRSPTVSTITSTNTNANPITTDFPIPLPSQVSQSSTRAPSPKSKKKRVYSPYLQPNNNRLQIQNRFPILPQNIQANLPLHINIRMINLLFTIDLGRFMGEGFRNSELEFKNPTFIHSLIGLDIEEEIENIVFVGEIGAHGGGEGHFRDI